MLYKRIDIDGDGKVNFSDFSFYLELGKNNKMRNIQKSISENSKIYNNTNKFDENINPYKSRDLYNNGENNLEIDELIKIKENNSLKIEKNKSNGSKI